MTTPATLPDTPNADGSQPLATFFTSLSHSAGINKMVGDIYRAWQRLGTAASDGTQQGYVRVYDDNGHSILIPSGAAKDTGLLVNRGFTHWPEGTSFASIANGTYGPAMWRYDKVGAMVHDLSRSTSVPAVGALTPLQNYSVLIDCTTVDSSLAAGDVCIFSQRAMGWSFLPYAQRTISIGFWHNHTKVGTYCVALVNSGADRSCVAEYTQSVSNADQYSVVTFPASPAAGTWDYTTGIGLRVVFTLASGTTFQTTAGAWQSGLFYATANQVNACDSTNNNFRLSMIQPTPASVAKAFAQRGEPEESLAVGQFVQLIGREVSGQVVGATTVVTNKTFVPEMRATPTVTITDTSMTYIEYGVGTGTSSGSAISFSDIGTRGCTIQVSGFSGLTSPNRMSVTQDWGIAKALL